MARDTGDYDRARACYRESLSLRVERGDVVSIVQSLEDFSGLALREGHSERAARLLGAAEALCVNTGRAAPAGLEADYRRTVDAVRQELGEDAFAKTWREGLVMPMEQAVDYALDVRELYS